MTLTFAYANRRAFRGVLSTGRAYQVDAADAFSSAAVDDNLFDEAVGWGRLARRLAPHVTLRRHLEARPDVGQVRAVRARARRVQQLRRQFQFVRPLRGCAERQTDRQTDSYNATTRLVKHNFQPCVRSAIKYA